MPKVTQLLGTERGPERRSRDSLPSAHLRSVGCVQRFRASRQGAFKSFGGKPGRRWQSLILAAPPLKYTAEARRVGDGEAGFGGKGTSDLHVGAGGRELSPVPVGRQAGTGSQEQCLLSGACQPRGCARSGGGVGTPCALLSGKQCCREMGAEVVGGSRCSSGALGPPAAPLTLFGSKVTL